MRRPHVATARTSPWRPHASRRSGKSRSMATEPRSDEPDPLRASVAWHSRARGSGSGDSGSDIRNTRLGAGLSIEAACRGRRDRARPCSAGSSAAPSTAATVEQTLSRVRRRRDAVQRPARTRASLGRATPAMGDCSSDFEHDCRRVRPGGPRFRSRSPATFRALGCDDRADADTDRGSRRRCRLVDAQSGATGASPSSGGDSRRSRVTDPAAPGHEHEP